MSLAIFGDFSSFGVVSEEVLDFAHHELALGESQGVVDFGEDLMSAPHQFDRLVGAPEVARDVS